MYDLVIDTEDLSTKRRLLRCEMLRAFEKTIAESSTIVRSDRMRQNPMERGVYMNDIRLLQQRDPPGIAESFRKSEDMCDMALDHWLFRVLFPVAVVAELRDRGIGTLHGFGVMPLELSKRAFARHGYTLPFALERLSAYLKEITLMQPLKAGYTRCLEEVL